MTKRLANGGLIMGTERSSHRRASVLAWVGVTVIGGSSAAFAQGEPASPPAATGSAATRGPVSGDPPAPSDPATGNQMPPAGHPPPAASGYTSGGGYPPGGGYPAPPPGNYPAPYPYQNNGYGPPSPYQPIGYVRLPPPNVHDGLYLRLHLGFGYTSLKGTSAAGEELSISGASVSLGVALGGTIAPNLVIFGSFMASLAEQPDVTVNGESAGTASGSGGIFGLGVGVAYYIQPTNVYVSGTIGGMQIDLSDADGNSVYDSKFGFGFQGLVGKEWWVSSEWGLGIAAEVIVAGHMKDKTSSSVTWTGRAFNVLFSATCN